MFYNEKGIMGKTCVKRRHNKRSLSVFDDWHQFMDELLHSSGIIQGQKTLSLDALPVPFGNKLTVNEEGNASRNELNSAVGSLANLILDKCGFR